MKLTEKQLAELFQNNSKKHTSTSNASDCLDATAASTNRINHVEDIANDYTSAAAMKTAMSLKDWSQVMAQSIDNTKQTWFSFLGMGSPMKTAFATLTFAFAFVVAMPEFNLYNQQQSVETVTIQESVATNDVINSFKFDDNVDQLQKNGFDGSKELSDDLFNNSFG